ncbi:hypothetical protein CLF_106526 [Clonorchis sinensis]|uniref:Uncharacterized protein n=1 Tax=Clonorchis sinensis TaxID=79923 RepID=G7YFA6_CLOSI|nr:hypothetical protein CLF_106526 [Clonorchis sinensis]
MPTITPPNWNTTPQQEVFIADDKLPLKLGVALLTATVTILLLCLLFLVCRRIRKYQRLDGDEDDEDELYNTSDGAVRWSDKEKVRLTGFVQRVSETPIKPARVRKDQAVSDHNSLTPAFSIGDENEDLSDVESGQTTYRPIGACSAAASVMNNVVTVPQQLSQGKSANENHIGFSTVFSDETQPPILKRSFEATDDIPESCTLRRVSSTPNIQLSLFQATKLPIQLSRAENWDIPEQDETPILDDADLFKKGCSEEELEMVNEDGTLVESSELSLIHPTGSIGDIGSVRPLLPIRLPEWALESGKPERGFLVFSLSINRQPNSIVPKCLVNVRVLEARCVLSRYTEPRAGKFYVKARVQLAGTSASPSMFSLDQIHSAPKRFITDRFHLSSSSRSSVESCGSTLVRRAFRSPVFWQAITLGTLLPDYLTKQEDAGQTGISMQSVDQLELRLDLKERSALKKDELYGGNSGLTFPSWKHSSLLGSVRIPLTPEIWSYFLKPPEDARSRPLRRSTLVPEDDLEDTITDEGKNHDESCNRPRVLRFIRQLEVPPEDAEDRGDLTLGMQYNPETTKLTLNPLKCTGVHLPRGAKSVFLVATLASNRKIIATQQSNQSARLNMNAVEFLLGERLQFVVEEHMSQVCLILSVFARSGRRINETTSLIGRCVVGPDGLAYGQGLSQWQAVTEQRGMVKRTHVLF